jgi:hypothetical protein
VDGIFDGYIYIYIIYIYNRYIIPLYLVGGWALPLWKMMEWKPVGMIIPFPTVSGKSWKFHGSSHHQPDDYGWNMKSHQKSKWWWLGDLGMVNMIGDYCVNHMRFEVKARTRQSLCHWKTNEQPCSVFATSETGHSEADSAFAVNSSLSILQHLVLTYINPTSEIAWCQLVSRFPVTASTAYLKAGFEMFCDKPWCAMVKHAIQWGNSHTWYVIGESLKIVLT